MKWSYKTVHFELKKEGLLGVGILDESEIEQALNDFGKSGWELISVLEVQDGIITFFKQPLGMETRYQYGQEDEDDLDRETADSLPEQDEGDTDDSEDPAGSVTDEGGSHNRIGIGAIRIE